MHRRLGDHAGLSTFGVNLTRIVPGGQSPARHAHSRQDEFIWLVSGEIVLETVNRSNADATILVVGGRCKAVWHRPCAGTAEKVREKHREPGSV